MTFNLVLSLAAFVAFFACFRRQREQVVANQEMRRSQQELLGRIQEVLATVSSEVDRLHRLIPEGEAPEARQITQGLVGAIDQIILITRGDWEG